MSDGPLLLNRILQCPDDKTLRLVYADWLEENGDPEWAMFIRNCVAKKKPKGYGILQHRKNFLEKRFGRYGINSRSAVGFCQKGMLEEVRITVKDFFESGVIELFSQHPIQHVRFQDFYLWVGSDTVIPIDRRHLNRMISILPNFTDGFRVKFKDDSTAILRVRYPHIYEIRKQFPEAVCCWARKQTTIVNSKLLCERH